MPLRIRAVYSDLDGTMVGPGGSFFVAEDGERTLEPARALVDLHAAGLPLVLVSGRTRPQLVEACRLVGADGYVAELGAVVGWDRGRCYEVLTGAMPALYGGAPAMEMESSGIIDGLLEQYAGRLELHSPWHEGHEADVMLRGLVDVEQAELWLAGRGFGWLRLRDNGVLPRARPTGLEPEAVPAHVYHLLPDGLSKGLGVARDMARRGLRREEVVAVGDSASDLDMAPYVSRLFLTANGAREPHMAVLLEAHDNLVVTDGAMGAGWVEAVRAALEDV